MKKEEKVLEIRTAEEFFKLLKQHQGDLTNLGKYKVYAEINFSDWTDLFKEECIPYPIKLGTGAFLNNFRIFSMQMLDLYFENAGFLHIPIIQHGSIVRIFDDNHYFNGYGIQWFQSNYRQVPNDRFLRGY